MSTISAIYGSVAFFTAVTGNELVAAVAGGIAVGATAGQMVITGIRWATGELTPEQAILSLGVSGASMVSGVAGISKGVLQPAWLGLSRALGIGSWGMDLGTLFSPSQRVPRNWVDPPTAKCFRRA